jgi:hypothetical protein
MQPTRDFNLSFERFHVDLKILQPDDDHLTLKKMPAQRTSPHITRKTNKIIDPHGIHTKSIQKSKKHIRTYIPKTLKKKTKNIPESHIS